MDPVVVATLAWGNDVLAVHVARPGEMITVGEDGASTFYVPGVARFVALAWDGDAPVGAGTMHFFGAFALSFEVSAAEPRAPRRSGIGARWQIAAAALVHAIVLGASAYASPSMWRGGFDDEASRDDLLRMYAVLSSGGAGESVPPPPPPPAIEATVHDATTGAMAGASASMATRERDDDGPSARRGHAESAASFGMIGLLATPPVAAADAWGSPLGAPIGESLWGNGAGEGGGTGLALAGVGEGGGGLGAGVDVEPKGRDGAERVLVARDPGRGRGLGHGRLGGSHTTNFRCILHDPLVTVEGRLPPETIQRVVRQNFGRFRACYETAASTDPGLFGRVDVKFTIGRGGDVSAAIDGGSSLASPSVVACVVRGFSSLSFPAPGAPVTVDYPIAFTME